MCVCVCACVRVCDCKTTWVLGANQTARLLIHQEPPFFFFLNFCSLKNSNNYPLTTRLKKTPISGTLCYDVHLRHQSYFRSVAVAHFDIFNIIFQFYSDQHLPPFLFVFPYIYIYIYIYIMRTLWHYIINYGSSLKTNVNNGQLCWAWTKLARLPRRRDEDYCD